VETPTYDEPTSPGEDRASKVRARASDIGHKAAASIDDKRDTVARGMDSAASTLRDRAEAMPGGKVARAAHGAAGAMETAADYVREHDVQGMITDVREGVKRHPGVTLLTAAAVGFLLARTFSRH
jgi:hypothetical protein